LAPIEDHKLSFETSIKWHSNKPILQGSGIQGRTLRSWAHSKGIKGTSRIEFHNAPIVITIASRSDEGLQLFKFQALERINLKGGCTKFEWGWITVFHKIPLIALITITFEHCLNALFMKPNLRLLIATIFKLCSNAACDKL